MFYKKYSNLFEVNKNIFWRFHLKHKKNLMYIFRQNYINEKEIFNKKIILEKSFTKDNRIFLQ